jgi:hypothetical protein
VQWRLCRANSAYKLCGSYPALLAVPATVDDAALVEASHFRTSCRLPTLTWLNPANPASSLTRCSQAPALPRPPAHAA